MKKKRNQQPKQGIPIIHTNLNWNITHEDSVFRDYPYFSTKIGSKTHVGVAIWVGPTHPSFGSISSMSSSIKTCMKKPFWTSGSDLAALLIFLALIFAIFISNWKLNFTFRCVQSLIHKVEIT